jgi:hypothetical protein
LFAGPYFAYGIAGKYEFKAEATGIPTEEETGDIKFGSNSDSDIKPLDFGLNIGAGVELNNFLLRAQYGLGLADLDPQGADEFKVYNRVIGISFGYMFGR